MAGCVRAAGYLTALPVLLLLLLSTAFTDAQSDSLADQAGEVGQSVVFACGVTGSPTNLEWRRYTSQDPDTGAGTRIYSITGGNLFPAKYNVSTQYDLQVKNLAVEDGGQYECYDFDQDKKKYGSLTALDPPSFSLPAAINDGDVLLITCTVHYGANPDDRNAPAKIPNIEIRVGGNVVTGYTDARPTEIISYEYSIGGNATYTASVSDHNADVTCSAVMSEPDVTVTSSETLNVKHQATNMELDPPLSTQSVLYVGEFLNCSADGYPEPTYTWIAHSVPGLQPGDRLPGAVLEMQPEWAGSNMWSCEATNSEGTTNISAAFVLEDPSVGNTKNQPEDWVIAISVVIPVLVIAAVVIVVIILLRRKKKQQAATRSVRSPYMSSSTAVSKPYTGAAYPAEGPLYGHSTHQPSIPSGVVDSGDPTIRRVQDSPGVADLGIRHLSNAYPGLNTSGGSHHSSMSSINRDNQVNLLPDPAARAHRPTVRYAVPHVTRGSNSSLAGSGMGAGAGAGVGGQGYTAAPGSFV